MKDREVPIDGPYRYLRFLAVRQVLLSLLFVLLEIPSYPFAVSDVLYVPVLFLTIAFDRLGDSHRWVMKLLLFLPHGLVFLDHNRSDLGHILAAEELVELDHPVEGEPEGIRFLIRLSPFPKPDTEFVEGYWLDASPDIQEPVLRYFSLDLRDHLGCRTSLGAYALLYQLPFEPEADIEVSSSTKDIRLYF